MKDQKTKKLTGRVFDALPAAEKERIFQELEKETPEQRRAKWKAPITTADRAMLKRLKKKIGRLRQKPFCPDVQMR